MLFEGTYLYNASQLQRIINQSCISDRELLGESKVVKIVNGYSVLR
jgi:hypothetical protein